MRKMLEERCEDVIDERLKGWISDFEVAINGRVPEQVGEKEGEFEFGEFDFMKWLNEFPLKYEDDPYYRAKRLYFKQDGCEDSFVFFKDGSIKYYYLHWYDSASRTLYGYNGAIMKKVQRKIEWLSED